MNLRIVILSILMVFFHLTVFSQKTDLDAREWSKDLADPGDLKNEAATKLYYTLATFDSAKVFEFINKLGKESSVKGHYFLARYNTVKAQMIRWFNPPEPASSTFVRDSIKRKVTSLLDVALQQAYIADDDYLAAYVSSIYGNAMSGFGNTEKAVMYLMNSAELYDKVHLHAQVAAYILLGETLWRVREYEKSIYYTKIAIRLMTSPEDKQHKLDTPSIMMCNNTIGLAYQRLGLNDSASFYYARSLQLLSSLSDEKGKETWKGIISGNIAQIDFAQGKYISALPLFMMDYQTSNGYGFFDEAADAIQWAAKTNLALGNKSAALAQVRESFSLLKKWPNAANYRQHAYLTSSEIFKSIGEDGSAYFYSGKYNVLHDSLEKVIYQSSISISQLRLNNEKNRYNIRNLEVVKNDQIQKRNYIIAVIAILSAFILLIVNRQRQKSKYRLQLEHAEKIRIEADMEAAKTQMKMFTQSIIEKTSLIEKLESQVPKENSSRENQQLIDDLSHQTILTEDDWLYFKILFEKMYPSFFEKIINQVNNITQAEQRMASLTLLHLTTKQMAAILGISSNSVIKAKQRLRQRLDLLTDQEVEEFMAKL